MSISSLTPETGKKRFSWTMSFFVGICAMYLMHAYLLNNFVFTDSFYYESLVGSMSIDSIDAILSFRGRFFFINYISIPLIIFNKVVFATACISIGAILMDIDFKFSSVFKVCVLAEISFITAQFIFLSNLYRNLKAVTLETSANYFPVSMLSYLGVENVVPWLHYPLQTLNLIEAAYILCISWLVSKQWNPNFIESINIVLPSYGIGLLIWMVLVVFLTLQIS